MAGMWGMYEERKELNTMMGTVNSLVLWKYAGNMNSITGSGRSPEVGNCLPLQCSWQRV